MCGPSLENTKTKQKYYPIKGTLRKRAFISTNGAVCEAEAVAKILLRLRFIQQSISSVGPQAPKLSQENLNGPRALIGPCVGPK